MSSTSYAGMSGTTDPVRLNSEDDEEPNEEPDPDDEDNDPVAE